MIFLNRKLAKQYIYMSQHPAFAEKGEGETLMCRLEKGLYGLKRVGSSVMRNSILTCNNLYMTDSG